MNLSLKRPGRKPRRKLEDMDDSHQAKAQKVTHLEPQAVQTSSNKVIVLDNDSQVQWESLDYDEDLESRPDEPTQESYKSMSVAEFGAALRRGLGTRAESDNPNVNSRQQQAHKGVAGIGYKQPTANSKQNLN